MFKYRSHKKELLDGDHISEKALFLNLKELDTINRLLGGYRTTLSALTKVIERGQTYSLLDIGCGGGYTLQRIEKWRLEKGHSMTLSGVDIKQACISYAKKNSVGDNLTFICDDYRNSLQFMKKPDIIHACLFCHHLNEEQLIDMIRFTLSHQSTLIINDLQRHPIAYYSIRWLTNIFSKSYLVKNDAPLSVLRGFKKKEWLNILHKAGAQNFSVKNKWAFRHRIIVHGN